MQTVYFAGGCLWGVQEFMKHLPGVVATQAGRVNGTTQSTQAPYDGYAECVKTTFDPKLVTLEELIHYFFEIIDPYSLNQQGEDIGPKYRTGIYSEEPCHLQTAQACIDELEQTLNQQHQTSQKIVVEVLPMLNYIPSADEHQDRLTRCPDDYCHIPLDLLHKYKHKSV